MSELTREIQQQLLAPFPEDEISFLPRGVRRGQAQALPYIDARSVMRRLDAVVGPDNWTFDFEPLNAGGTAIKGVLCICGVAKADAGEAAEESEPVKAAVSDALKRCGVHFGIARYLYYLPTLWRPYDTERRRFTEPVRLKPQDVQRALTLCGYEGAAAQPTAPASAPAPSPPRASAPTPSAELTCSAPGCNHSLNKGQHDLSVRAYGRPLCPKCQRKARRVAAAEPPAPGGDK